LPGLSRLHLNILKGEFIMLDLENLPEGITREKALEFMRIAEQVKRDQERFERENAETPEETEAINIEIEKLLKEYPGSRILSDGSLAMYDNQQKIRVRHTRKDLAPKGYSMLVASKCISAQILHFEANDPDYYPRPYYYQTILDDKNNLVRMDPRSYKWELDFGISYNDAVRLILMLNRKNPDKEFFLENF
jgi:hypothetical protein